MPGLSVESWYSVSLQESTAPLWAAEPRMYRSIGYFQQKKENVVQIKFSKDTLHLIWLVIFPLHTKTEFIKIAQWILKGSFLSCSGVGAVQVGGSAACCVWQVLVPLSFSFHLKSKSFSKLFLYHHSSVCKTDLRRIIYFCCLNYFHLRHYSY